MEKVKKREQIERMLGDQVWDQVWDQIQAAEFYEET